MTRKSGASGGKDKNRGLTEDDHELWQHTARSLQPLKRAKGRVHRAAAKEHDPAAVMRAAEPPARIGHKTPRPAHDVSPPASAPPVKAPVRKSPATIERFDERNLKKLRRGKIDIEARIDLHGMRQAEAHAALYRFLITSAAKGRRWVLVITGKGAPAARAVDKDETWSWGEPQRGILRRNVPIWLAEPELRGLVVSYTEAAVEHGGGGALYVHLRRQRHGHE